jgi:imidazolonepropionase-like amidohydrolase
MRSEIMSTMHVRARYVAGIALLALMMRPAAGEAPLVYAITGARVITVSGPTYDPGVVLLRNGVVEAVGAAVAIPADATVIEATGHTVYPGLIDMGNAAGLDVPAPPLPKDARTRLDLERWKRQVLLRPDVEAARFVRADSADLAKLAAYGITSVLAVPGGGAVAGRSSLLNVTAAEEEPQIGNIADPRTARMVVRSPVFLHARFPSVSEGDAYPNSLMGVIALVRQAFLDAGYAQAERARLEKTKGAIPTLPVDPAWEAVRPALGGRMPVVFDAQEAREIRRVLAFAREFGFDTIVAGGVEAHKVTEDLKAQKARVILSVNYPKRPTSLAPDEDEALSVLRRRASAPAVAAALDRAGVPFAFSSAGLKDMAAFTKNVGRAVKAGLPAEAAVRALTLGAATMAGAADRLGSIEKGRIANVIVTKGGLFDDSMTIAHVFVAGRPVVIDPPAPRAERQTR